MKINLLCLPFRQLFCSLLLVSSLWSCSDDDTSEQPVPVAGPTQTEFSLVDSIKVDARYETADPTLWRDYRGKTYTVASKDKTEAYFYEDDDAVVLVLRDTSRSKEQAFVSFTFPNRAITNLPATVSAKDAAIVCVEAGQKFEDGSTAFSPDCLQVRDGSLALQYDAATDVLSGTVTGLKLPLEYYVPKYSFPNHYGSALKASGSNRNLTITFKNVQRFKSK